MRVTFADGEWLGVPVKCTDKRWLSVKDERPAGLEPVKSAHDADKWVRDRVEYHEDRVDKWQLPSETLARGLGDCEDIALLKRAVLLENGWKDEDLLLLLVKDLISRRDHAILVAGGFVLDSFNSLTLPSEQVADYRPIKGFAGDRCWIFGKAAA